MKRMESKHIALLLVLALFTLVVTTCGEDNTRAGTVTLVGVHGIGDIVPVEGHVIVLDEIELHGDVLRANFTIRNRGDEDLPVSSILSFSAEESGGDDLTLQIFDCGDSSLDETIPPGGELRGDICWSGAIARSFEIHYRASLFSSGDAVWEVARR